MDHHRLHPLASEGLVDLCHHTVHLTYRSHAHVLPRPQHSPELYMSIQQSQSQEVLATRIAIIEQQSLRSQCSEFQCQTQRVIGPEGGEDQKGVALKSWHRGELYCRKQNRQI